MTAEIDNKTDPIEWPPVQRIHRQIKPETGQAIPTVKLFGANRVITRKGIQIRITPKDFDLRTIAILGSGGSYNRQQPGKQTDRYPHFYFLLYLELLSDNKN
jgi:hypothetical protein